MLAAELFTEKLDSKTDVRSKVYSCKAPPKKYLSLLVQIFIKPIEVSIFNQ